jgi:hypothetical protein
MFAASLSQCDPSQTYGGSGLMPINGPERAKRRHTGRSKAHGGGAAHRMSDPGSALRRKSNGGKIGLKATPIWGMSVSICAGEPTYLVLLRGPPRIRLIGATSR